MFQKPIPLFNSR